MHPDLKYMTDKAFFMNICLVLCDMFGYRSIITQDQFFELGFSERKLIFVLDIYDILKSTRKNIKINAKLSRVEAGAPHASDLAMVEYQVVNHRDNIAKNMLFKLNTQTQLRQLTVTEEVMLGSPAKSEAATVITQPGYVPLRNKPIDLF
jgi:hypothetical protein